MRVVLYTNQLVAALVRPPELATLLMAWESARFVPIASPALIDEYQHVLHNCAREILVGIQASHRRQAISCSCKARSISAG
jgi:predicted nucleic acid-binding protein